MENSGPALTVVTTSVTGMDRKVIELELEHKRASAQRQVADLQTLEGAMIAASKGDNSDDEHDPEGSTIAFERAQNAAIARDITSRLAQIDAALSRLHDGWDGHCLVCDEPIANERLIARPMTDKCIQHA